MRDTHLSKALDKFKQHGSSVSEVLAAVKADEMKKREPLTPEDIADIRNKLQIVSGNAELIANDGRANYEARRGAQVILISVKNIVKILEGAK